MRLSPLYASFILLGACGDGHFYASVYTDGGGGPGGGDDGGSAGSSDMAQPPAAYPAGPYGAKMGQTIPDHTLQGYRLTRQQTDSSVFMGKTSAIALGEYHSNPRCKCMLITVGALWCGACRQEQPALKNDAANDSNFCVLGVLQEGQGQGSDATVADLDSWTQAYSQNFFVAQGDGTTKHYWDSYAMNGVIGLPFNLVVTPADMHVVGSWQGYDPNGHAHAMGLCGM